MRGTAWEMILHGIRQMVGIVGVGYESLNGIVLIDSRWPAWQTFMDLGYSVLQLEIDMVECNEVSG